MIALDGPDDLTPAVYRRIVHDGEPVTAGEAALARVAQARALFLRHLESGVLCYGVNTGLGALAGIDLGPAERALLPRQILLGRAVAIGAPLPPRIARGALLIKLAQFLTGRSAVTPDLCRFLADRLNDGFTPHIPSEGHGMAGEIVPLAHLAQTLAGDGFVLGPDGARRAAADWFAAQAVTPYAPQSKEGLSLINGVAVAPARAFEAAAALRRSLALATLAAAATMEGLAASLEAIDPAVARLRPDPGLAELSAALRRLLDGSAVVRGARQPPVSVRVTPHVHAAAWAAIGSLERAAVAEWRAVSDNPAFLADAAAPRFGRLVHSGNFHCAELTQAVEAASLAAAQLALLSERRLHRLLDHRYSGLSPQLARRPGLDAGLVALHKAVLAFTARLRSLAVPPSLQHGDTSFGQEDFMTMALPALDRLEEIDRLVRRAAAYELYAGLVAVEERGAAPGAAVAGALAAVRTEIPPYAGDRSYGPELERLLEMIETGRLPLPDIAEES